MNKKGYIAEMRKLDNVPKHLLPEEEKIELPNQKMTAAQKLKMKAAMRK